MPDPTTPPAADTVTADIYREAFAAIHDALTAAATETSDDQRGLTVLERRALAVDSLVSSLLIYSEPPASPDLMRRAIAGFRARIADHGEAPCCAPVTDDHAECAGPRAGAEVVVR